MVVETATGDNHVQLCKGRVPEERAPRKGGEGGTSCSSYIPFLSFLIKGDERQP